MGYTDLLAVVFGSDSRLERKWCVFGDGQGIHVCAQCDSATWPSAPQDPDDPGVGHLCTHLKTQRAKMGRDQLGGLELAVAQFRILVDLVTHADRRFAG